MGCSVEGIWVLQGGVRVRREREEAMGAEGELRQRRPLLAHSPSPSDQHLTFPQGRFVFGAWPTPSLGPLLGRVVAVGLTFPGLGGERGEWLRAGQGVGRV